jgi:hypothetical protein
MEAHCQLLQEVMSSLDQARRQTGVVYHIVRGGSEQSHTHSGKTLRPRHGAVCVVYHSKVRRRCHTVTTVGSLICKHCQTEGDGTRRIYIVRLVIHR